VQLLQQQCPSIPIKPRGWIPIKGKDDMFTFWVNESKDKHHQNGMMEQHTGSNDGSNDSKNNTSATKDRHVVLRVDSIQEESSTDEETEILVA
jgi:hypothetical protein